MKKYCLLLFFFLLIFKINISAEDFYNSYRKAIEHYNKREFAESIKYFEIVVDKTKYSFDHIELLSWLHEKLNNAYLVTFGMSEDPVGSFQDYSSKLIDEYSQGKKLKLIEAITISGKTLDDMSDLKIIVDLYGNTIWGYEAYYKLQTYKSSENNQRNIKHLLNNIQRIETFINDHPNYPLIDIAYYELCEKYLSLIYIEPQNQQWKNKLKNVLNNSKSLLKNEYYILINEITYCESFENNKNKYNILLNTWKTFFTDTYFQQLDAELAKKGNQAPPKSVIKKKN